MKEFIDKLIEELEGVKSIVNSPADIVWNNAVKMCIYKANELAEEYKGGWIPLTKQLPKYGQYVLACVPPKDDINGGHPVVIMEFREDNEPLFYRFVSSWQPLPAPYTEGE